MNLRFLGMGQGSSWHGFHGLTRIFLNQDFFGICVVPFSRALILSFCSLSLAFSNLICSL